tara:strand:- start:353 stop:715 length:363 start_codon:yes stop_codon:yes gene_type:complete
VVTLRHIKYSVVIIDENTGIEMNKLNISLSEGQAKYVLWLEENMPFLLPLFDFEERSYKPEAVKQYLEVASHGETIMARFALGVWRHNDELNFDFIDAAQTLDVKNMKVVTDWLKNPFWP